MKRPDFIVCLIRFGLGLFLPIIGICMMLASFTASEKFNLPLLICGGVYTGIGVFMFNDFVNEPSDRP